MPKVARLKKSRNRRKKAGTKKRIHRHTRKYMHGGVITKYCWNGFFPSLAAWEENVPFSIWCKANSEEEARQKLTILFEIFTGEILPVYKQKIELNQMSIGNVSPHQILETSKRYVELMDSYPDVKDLVAFDQYEKRGGRERIVGIDTDNPDMNKYDLNTATLIVKEDDSHADIITFRQLLATEPTAC